MTHSPEIKQEYIEDFFFFLSCLKNKQMTSLNRNKTHSPDLLQLLAVLFQPKPVLELVVLKLRHAYVALICRGYCM